MCALTPTPYPRKVTPYYSGLAGSSAPDPVALQFEPGPGEQDSTGDTDPLGETEGCALPGLVHVYRDRVLLLPTEVCFVNCRHCNRRWRRVGASSRFSKETLESWLGYLREHPEVEDVLVTGGDPLTMPDRDIEQLLSGLRSGGHTGVIRIGTRAPCVEPERVSPALARMLSRFHPLFVNVQFNCVPECTPAARGALEVLADAGIPLGNQMVLLAGVNDSAAKIAAVSRFLVSSRCRPYYLFLPERVAGTSAFWVSPRRALEIASELRRSCSGLAMPSVVVDTPAGGGKVPIESGRCSVSGEVLTVVDNLGRKVVLDYTRS